MRIPPVLCGLVAAAALGVAGCATPESAKPATSSSLYDRLGGMQAITAVVDDFVGNLATDERIKAKFANANMPRLKTRLVEQICAGSGGPCTYAGLDMKTAHAGMAITNDEFDALVDDLVKSLDKFKVPAGEQKELLAILGPMRKDVVSR
ncbi:group I truncated hemoglobin [Cupriavidus taiwanensis]|uniref:group I truncated hemoglobin n=1 Tax=Cupriavidus taiwanensis TaxID=164546 RepID=UPI000E10EA52|nr:group 1 truncated hemoglobin [Cupriavidus taiwanensis]SOY68444.1 Hemoglobin-like protein HbN [Cupriavidus taiwanensis]SOY69774.1 Hemoglobin-like protein HbN [Cupriavidus taiwanensis]SOY95259.1 Hemoglobin-like protein HbN [Cupriavidus taiwanensis]SOZ71887.1 Hemoglobin-like protein HbN [Cupriavidus taiwanensis]SOZ87189.1 Hemoglobin-like protein HbN [Cupriavidus taiwanensis]